MTAADEHNLDIYEGYPNFYYKKNMKIRLSETGKMINAFVYIMHEERRFGIPTSAYVSTCKFGYTIFGFDFKYLDEAYEKSLKGVANNEKLKPRLKEPARNADVFILKFLHFPELIMKH